ncbi:MULTISPECIES: hypothetical protein [Streptomyces]|uniref:Uncharacterized protein n=1 Tax=Streptomyces viridochromogenes TaxID=1938 RepID=A0A0L8KH32_STRVR|nr:MULTISPECIES: hypothetical protein [Streptomyces]KOG25200.1 hypothetical protein ADK34_18125 [Streptomyces viridochromogenes]
MTVPHQSTTPRAPQDKLPEDRRHMIRRRWLTAVIIVLLVGIPAGYLVISAGQSRDSGRDKERESSAAGLQANRPSQMKRRVFEVPIPAGAWDVAYYETSNWKTSRLYVQFTTTATGLDAFLAESGTSRAQLVPGHVTVSERDADIADWTFDDGPTGGTATPPTGGAATPATVGTTAPATVGPSTGATEASGGATGATVWAGTTVTREEPRPDTDITVDLTDPAFPRVYAVSTTSP